MDKISEELETAARYRKRAEELRAMAENQPNAENRQALLNVAAQYELMAIAFAEIDRTYKQMKIPTWITPA